MAIDPNLIKATMETDEYQNGVSILGDPDDYATKTMLAFIGFFYMITVQKKANVEGMEGFLRQMGIEPIQNDQGLQLRCTDEEALTAAFTYIVGRGNKALFDDFLKLMKEHPEGIL